jgi:four helix bundle protein
MAKSNFMKWLAWKKGFQLAISISKMSKAKFPPEEQFVLTDQIKRASRSVCSNLAEGYAKRRYPKHFTAKLTDAMGENYETQNWLPFAFGEGYIDQMTLDSYMNASEEVGKLLSYMDKNPQQFANVNP